MIAITTNNSTKVKPDDETVALVRNESNCPLAVEIPFHLLTLHRTPPWLGQPKASSCLPRRPRTARPRRPRGRNPRPRHNQPSHEGASCDPRAGGVAASGSLFSDVSSKLLSVLIIYPTDSSARGQIINRNHERMNRFHPPSSRSDLNRSQSW